MVDHHVKHVDISLESLKSPWVSGHRRGA